MGSSKKKTTQVTDPAAWAKPALQQGVGQTQDVYAQNQGNLQNLSNTAYSGAQSLAQQAFNPNPYITNAQDIANRIGSGALYGTNPGAATYTRLQQPANDPSMGLLQGFANGDGKVTGNAPSAGLYDSLINGDPAQNPYVDALVNRASDDAIVAANRRFGAAGQGAGVSGALGQNIAKGVADASNAIRYQAYDDAANRQLQAAGQSDAVFNASQDRDVTQRAQNLSAAQALGQQYGQNEDRALDAAKASDTSNNTQIAQILQALGMQPSLAQGQYAGVQSALAALQAAASLPYTGTSAYNSNISQLTSPYNVTNTTTKTSSGLGGILGGALQLGGSLIPGLGSVGGLLGGASSFLGGAPTMGNALGSNPLANLGGLNLSGLNLNPSYY